MKQELITIERDQKIKLIGIIGEEYYLDSSDEFILALDKYLEGKTKELSPGIKAMSRQIINYGDITEKRFSNELIDNEGSKVVLYTRLTKIIDEPNKLDLKIYVHSANGEPTTLLGELEKEVLEIGNKYGRTDN